MDKGKGKLDHFGWLVSSVPCGDGCAHCDVRARSSQRRGRKSILIQIDSRFELSHREDWNVLVLKLGFCRPDRRRVGVEGDRSWVGRDGCPPAKATDSAQDETHQTGDQHDGDDREDEHLKVGPRHT